MGMPTIDRLTVAGPVVYRDWRATGQMEGSR